HLGTVRNRSYVACENTADARAFVAHQRATAAADPTWLGKSVAQLLQARDYHDGRVVPVTENVLAMRAAMIVDEAQRASAQLRLTQQRARLLDEERDEAVALLELLSDAE